MLVLLTTLVIQVSATMLVHFVMLSHGTDGADWNEAYIGLSYSHVQP